MKVKVAGRIFDSANVPIMLIFTEEEKLQLQEIDGNVFAITPRMNEEEKQNFIKMENK